MKKIIIALVAVCLIGNMYGQEEGKFRVGLNLGGAVPTGGFGFLIDIEPKYNLTDNMNVGLRFGSAIIAKELQLDNNDEFESADFSANNSYLATFDYYFPLEGSFTPFVGAGAGLFSIASVAGQDGVDVDSEDVDAEAKFGAMVRGGFEVGKFRMSLEYDFIPETNLQDGQGNEVGTIKNGYLGITVGFFVGGGRWG